MEEMVVEKKITIIQTGFDEKILDDTSRGYFFEQTDSSTLLITFGGIQQGIAIPVFEFFRSIQQYNVNKLFIRDFHQSWYHRGVASVGDNLLSIESFIKEVIRQSGSKKVIIVGNSAGGYAALLFGYLLKADAVHAFAPQVFIDRFNRLIHWDTRWKTQLKTLYKRKPQTTSFFDLNKLIHHPVEGDFNIYYCRKNRLDKIHARHIKESALIKLHSYDEGGHGVIKYLRDQGILDQILSESITEH